MTSAQEVGHSRRTLGEWFEAKRQWCRDHKRAIKAAGLLTLTAGGFVGGAIVENHFEGQRVVTAKNNANDRADAAIAAEQAHSRTVIGALGWLGNEGITPYVVGDPTHKAEGITLKGGRTYVTLSLTPEATKPACEIAFEFSGADLVLSQADQLGRQFDQVHVTDGQHARAALQDICPTQ